MVPLNWPENGDGRNGDGRWTKELLNHTWWTRSIWVRLNRLEKDIVLFGPRFWCWGRKVVVGPPELLMIIPCVCAHFLTCNVCIVFPFKIGNLFLIQLLASELVKIWHSYISSVTMQWFGTIELVYDGDGRGLWKLLSYTWWNCRVWVILICLDQNYNHGWCPGSDVKAWKSL